MPRFFLCYFYRTTIPGMELEQLSLQDQFEEITSRDDKLEIHEFLNSQNISDFAELHKNNEE